MQGFKNDLLDIVKLSITIGLASTSTVFLGSLMCYERDKLWQNNAALGFIGCSIGAMWYSKKH